MVYGTRSIIFPKPDYMYAYTKEYHSLRVSICFLTYTAYSPRGLSLPHLETRTANSPDLTSLPIPMAVYDGGVIPDCDRCADGKQNQKQFFSTRTICCNGL